MVIAAVFAREDVISSNDLLEREYRGSGFSIRGVEL